MTTSELWVVSTCVPGEAEPCFPSVFTTYAAAEAYADEMLRAEWDANQPEDDEGNVLPYPGNWLAAVEHLAAENPGTWGKWEITGPHRVEAPAAPSAMFAGYTVEPHIPHGSGDAEFRIVDGERVIAIIDPDMAFHDRAEDLAFDIVRTLRGADTIIPEALAAYRDLVEAAESAGWDATDNAPILNRAREGYAAASVGHDPLRDSIAAIIAAHRGDSPDPDTATEAEIEVHDLVEMLREALRGERTVTAPAADHPNALQALAAILPLATAHVEDWESGAADGTYEDNDALPAARAAVDAAAALLASHAPEPAPAPDPHELAARAAGWTHGGDNDGFIFHAATWSGSWKAAASWSGEDGHEPDGAEDHPATYGTWEECCEAEGIEVAP
ncbi:MAG: hypothetical protein KIS96_11550 [Bauldia sp.]|nr:hypothetical protein [Bauldia sp.]